MKVILLDNTKGVGKKDEVINASDGYARNYLLPKKLAVEANTENMSKLKARNDSIQIKFIYSICAGLNISIRDFFDRPYFENEVLTD